MGRYDKIKVYNNGSWHTPNRVRVYQNGWQDLGTNDSANRQTLYVEDENQFKRATLNRKETQVVSDRWATGPFKVWPVHGYNSRPDAGCPFEISIDNIRHTGNHDADIFYAAASDWSSYIQIVWLADGRVRFRTCYNGTMRETYSSNAVGLNQSVSLKCYTYQDSYVKQAIIFDGVWSGGGGTSCMSLGYFPNTVCGGGIEFRGTLSVKGSSYSNGNVYANSRSFNTSTVPSGSDNYNYQDLTHHETSTTTITWE